MSNPKKKAQELVKKMYGSIFDGGQYEEAQEGWYKANQCALIAVDEIIKANPIIPLQFMLESEALDAAIEYWQEVKEEITKL